MKFAVSMYATFTDRGPFRLDETVQGDSLDDVFENLDPNDTADEIRDKNEELKSLTIVVTRVEETPS